MQQLASAVELDHGTDFVSLFEKTERVSELCFKVVVAYIAGKLNFLYFNNLLSLFCFFFAFFV